MEMQTDPANAKGRCASRGPGGGRCTPMLGMCPALSQAGWGSNGFFFSSLLCLQKKKKTQSGKLCQAGLEQRLGTELIIVMLMSC